MSVIRPFVPLMRTLGSLYTQLFDGKVEKLEIIYGGEISGYPVSTLTTSFLIGMLSVILKETVNYVNAPLIAKQRGIKIREITSSTADNFTNLVTVHVKTGDGVKTLAGTIFNDKDIRIVQIDKYRIEVVPSRYMLVATYNDMPGVIGRFGIILGDSNINIAGMQVGRQSLGGEAVMVVQVDSPVPEDVLQQLQEIDAILSVRFVKLE
jgi:D-3-phosphoglycerate dehydrogenase